MKSQIITGIDLGTEETKVLVAELGSNNGVKVLGMGFSPTQGIRKGVIVNIDSASQSLRQAINQANLSSGIKITDAYFNCTGSQIESATNTATIAIRNKDITKEDVDLLMTQAREIPLSSDQEIVHLLPQSFTIDNEHLVKNPLGISAKTLETKVHLILNSLSISRNINRLAHLAKISNKGLIFSPIAAAEAILLKDEKELGTLVLDIGAGTTDIVLYFNGTPRFSFSLPIGGSHITNDIAACLRTSFLAAEDLKQNYGHSIYSAIRNDEKIEVLAVTGKVSRLENRLELVKIIRARIFEMFSLIRDAVIDNGFESIIRSGVVITGGTAKLKGICELGEEIFSCPVRIGRPIHFQGLNDAVVKPEITTALGLSLYSAKCQENYSKIDRNVLSELVRKTSNWWKEHF